MAFSLKNSLRQWRSKRKHANQMVVLRKKQIKQKRAAAVAANSGRNGAVTYAESFAGKVVENPAGSNRGGKITEWENHLGAWLVGAPWCGVFCANMLMHAKVKGVTSRLASVALIEDDARAGKGCFRGWTLDQAQVKPGDLVVLFGRGVHVEIVRHVDRKTGLIYTVGGNTSSGSGGSQSNGGGVYARVRNRGDAHGFALVRF